MVKQSVEIDYYVTTSGRNPYEDDFRRKLVKKDPNAIYVADGLIKELKKDEESCKARGILKPLDSTIGLFELKRKGGKEVRIGLYLASIPGTKKYVVLHAFKKKCRETPPNEIDIMKNRIKDYIERFVRTKNEK